MSLRLLRTPSGIRRYAFPILLALAWGIAATAAAQEGEDEAEGPRARAMALFDTGRQQIDDGDADAGIESCEEAYGVYPTPAALARLGACYEWAGQTDDAVDTYRRTFRSSAADASVRDFAASAIERLTGERPVEQPEERRQGGERGRGEPSPRAEEPDHALPWAFTVGAILLAAGAGATGAWTYSLWSDLDGQAGDLRAIRASHPPPYDEPGYANAYADIQDQNPTLELLSELTLAIGGAAVVAGVVALVLWMTSD